MRVVIPSVAYADFLAVVLPAWQRFLPTADLTVVTSPADARTRQVAHACRVTVLVTDAWTRNVPVQNTDKAGHPTPRPPVLNKALALDEAFGFVPGHRDPPAPGDCCLALDADVIPAGPLWPSDEIAPNILYGAPRYLCPTSDQCEAFLAGRRPLQTFALIHNRLSKGEVPTGTPDSEARKCLGYFQLFRFRPGLRFGSFADASKYDLVFRHHFGGFQRAPGFAVLHLGDRTSSNHQGRTIPQWTPQGTVCR